VIEETHLRPRVWLGSTRPVRRKPEADIPQGKKKRNRRVFCVVDTPDGAFLRAAT